MKFIKIYRDGIKIYPLKFGLIFRLSKNIKGIGIWKDNFNLYLGLYVVIMISIIYMN